MNEEMKMIMDGVTEGLAEELLLKLFEDSSYKNFEEEFFTNIKKIEKILQDNHNAKKLFESFIILVLERDDMLRKTVCKQAFLQGVSFCNHIRSTL